MPLGNPAGAGGDPADPRRFLLRRAQYALEYNDSTRTANWVSWSLGLADLGASGRGDFAADTSLPANLTRVQPEDYSGSGFDRGHLCPSGDRTVTVADNQATFYMTNILPQTPDHNQGVWASFESYCRSLAGLGHEILVVTGPSGFGAERLPGGIAVPAHVWKIAVVVPPGPGSALSRITAATRVIAIKVPNIPGIRTNPWQQYLTSAARLQTDTGYTFFSELPPETAAALRAKVDEPSTAGAPRITAQPASQAAALGGAATEVAAVTVEGILVAKQTLGEPLPQGADTSRHLPSSLIEIPSRFLRANRDHPRLFFLGESPWLVADLHARNFVRCTDGELRVIDIVAAPWPESASPRDPLMTEWLERVRRDPGAGALRASPDDEL